jgi:hypothetical protein
MPFSVSVKKMLVQTNKKLDFRHTKNKSKIISIEDCKTGPLPTGNLNCEVH